MNSKITKYLSLFDFDIRKTKDARFIDQKVTPDVLSFVSECIIEFVEDDINKEFTINDIRYSEYANNLVTDIFGKPGIKNAENEYDKFFSQPIKMLAYAQILQEDKSKRTHKFKIKNFEILEYISVRERNSYKFIVQYLEKVLKDSDLFTSFETFFNTQTVREFNKLKSNYIDFIISNTAIKKETEPKRIFTKIINPLALDRKKFGTRKGFMSKTSISFNELLYNRPNWRDVGKDKSISRNEFLETFESNIDNLSHYNYSISKAKRFVKQIHKYSEIHRFENYPALQAHHIFPQNEYPEIADFPENIIAITPNQHFYRAHPKNKTAIIDPNYQLICLISKLDSIEIDYRTNKDDYNFEDFINVLNTGYDTDFFQKTMEFEEVKHQIVNNYFERIKR